MAKPKIQYPFLILLSFLLIVVFVFRKDLGIAGAANIPPYLSGYAWSSNIGWISFRNDTTDPSSIPYGVDYNSSNGFLSGYAWSSNIGWISFGCGQDDGVGGKLCSADSFTTDNYPPSSGNSGSRPAFSTTENKLIGFARACSVFVNGCSGPLRGGGINSLALGDWDGWISLNGTTASGNDEYKIAYNDATKRLTGFAWGGGQEDDGGGNNISPQFPGWIDMSGTGWGGACPDGSQPVSGRCGGFGTSCPNGTIPINGECGGFGPPGGGSCPDGTLTVNGLCVSGVKLCDQPDCGVPATTGISCTHIPAFGPPYPVITTDVEKNDVTWKAEVTPPGPYSYKWILGSSKVAGTEDDGADYQLVGGSVNSDTIKVRYYKSGPWTSDDLDVLVTGGTLPPEGVKCPANVVNYTVGDKGFHISASASMTAQFIRSIRSITFPDIILKIEPYGGFDENTVSIDFKKILEPALSSCTTSIDCIKGLTAVNSNRALIVESQMWKTDNPAIVTNGPITLSKVGTNPDGTAVYDNAVLRLKLTKNQSPTADQSLPSKPDYQVVVDSINGGSELKIPLKINNPSGGVIEK